MGGSVIASFDLMHLEFYDVKPQFGAGPRELNEAHVKTHNPVKSPITVLSKVTLHIVSHPCCIYGLYLEA